jgi:GSH-dependent disulfide-bond oxidoreductase
MIKFYYHPAPNPLKVALFLEESGLPYEVVPLDTRKGEQFAPSFMTLNPNSKTPVITDGDVRVFDSTAILLYLAEKTGQFLPENTPKKRGEWLSWLMFISSGVGPYSGQAVHFKYHAPKGLDYALERYQFEARRTTAFSMRKSQPGRICWAPPTPLPTCRRGAGRVPCLSSWARTRGPHCLT